MNQDPIGLEGGFNVYQFALNAQDWIDPLGLVKSKKPVNLPSIKRIKVDMPHIMDRHTKCGDVAKQSGKKDLFPENMTERQIKKAILEAYSKAKRIRTQSGDSNKVLVRGQADGMTIEMWVNKATKLIETAYPIKGGVSL